MRANLPSSSLDMNTYSVSNSGDRDVRAGAEARKGDRHDRPISLHFSAVMRSSWSAAARSLRSPMRPRSLVPPESASGNASILRWTVCARLDRISGRCMSRSVSGPLKRLWHGRHNPFVSPTALPHIAPRPAPRYSCGMFRSVCLIALSLCAMAPAADSPQWRGPNRDGKSTETGLLQQWPAGGPRLVSKAPGLGEGYSSFAVVGNRLYTQGQQGDRAFVIALDVATGKQVWKTPSGRALGNDKGNGPRGTPTVDGNRLYAVAGDGTLVCLETDTGKRVWGTNFVADFSGREPHWGYSESPLVEGDRVIVTPRASGAAIVALNRKSTRL